ncbi:MAG: FAD-binding protein, partial [Acidobacteriota bacterium]
DSPEAHAADTVAAGAGLCHDEVVRAITHEGPARIAELVEWGALFDRRPDGTLELGREGAHNLDRVAHATGDATGAELVRTLVSAITDSSKVEILEHHIVVDLLFERGRVVGVVAIARDGRPLLITAAEVILATGGVGQLFAHTTNPVEATGDGLALAAGVGARSAGLELVQFHPTVLDGPDRPMALLTEALRGEGAVLVDDKGERFMGRVHVMADLGPRDVISRAIARRRRLGRRVFLDATGLGETVNRRFPTVAELCARQKLDPSQDLLPVVPAAHYHMGGIVTDLEGRTSVPGLRACGEVAFTGMHGANRLASNSLLEALVVGARCGEDLARTSHRIPVAVSDVQSRSDFPWADSPWLDDGGNTSAANDLRGIMEAGAGVERTQGSLGVAREQLQELRRNVVSQPGELAHMMRVATLILKAAETRTESRGAHFRADVPWSSPCWLQDLVFEGDRLIPPHVVQPAAAVG